LFFLCVASVQHCEMYKSAGRKKKTKQTSFEKQNFL
jgi:hypothetical protein